MKLYVEVNSEKHYIEKDIVEKYGLKEGQTTPSLGLEIKKENNSAVETEIIVETESVKETESFDETKIDKDIGETL